MKNLSLAFVLLAALSAPSVARNSACADYRICDNQASSNENVDAAPLATTNADQENGEWVSGRYGMTKDAKELRRWDEQND
jgi:uncharacterized membrane protein